MRASGAGRHAAGGARPRLRPGARQPGRAGPDRPRRFRSRRAAPRARLARRSRRWSPRASGSSRLGIGARAQALGDAPIRERAEEIARRRSAADRRRSDGRAVQGDRAPFAGLAGAGGVRMTSLTRDATADDLPTIDRLFRASFTDTFGASLQRSRTSRPSSPKFTPELGRASSPIRASPSARRGRRRARRLRQARPVGPAGRAERPRRARAPPALRAQGGHGSGHRRRS